MTLQALSPTQAVQAAELYEAAFPEYERRPTEAWSQMIGTHSVFKALAICSNEGAFCGFITLWTFEEFVYVEHFALLPSVRSAGLGGQVLERIKVLHAPLPLVLEVEPPNTDMAIRRIGFYQRHGLQLIPLPYSQPGYRIGAPWVALPVMATQAEWVQAHFEEIKKKIHREVYGVNV